MVDSSVITTVGIEKTIQNRNVRIPQGGNQADEGKVSYRYATLTFGRL